MSPGQQLRVLSPANPDRSPLFEKIAPLRPELLELLSLEKRGMDF